MAERSIIIIGAGFAGLAAGIYAQMNGYQSEIFEMHSLPGGLCTAWKRAGYTVDGCIHWLIGSSPQSFLHRYWQEVGLIKDRTFIDLDEYVRYEGHNGRTFILYSDVDRLEKHMLEFSPEDADATREFISGIRMGLTWLDEPLETEPLQRRLKKKLQVSWITLTRQQEVQKWMNTTAGEFSKRFKDPLIRTAISEMWFPDFAMFFMLFTLASLSNKNAGYPIGGSLPLALTLAKRYHELGGKIHFDSRVEKILVEKDQAVGIRLENGSEQRAARVVSAADGYATIFKMLEGKYADEKTREPYEKWPSFPPLIYIGLGVKRTFEDEPKVVSGIKFPLLQPTMIGDSVRGGLSVQIYNQDPTLAPAGKTSLVVMLPSSYAYWKELAQDRAAYDEKKSQIAHTVVELLEQRFPGISQQVEMVDVSTPLTFERYTGNWQGCFEGWLITPQNAETDKKPMSQTLPGLHNFYMVGQWVQPGGGLPSGVMTARRLIQNLCKQDKHKFHTTIT